MVTAILEALEEVWDAVKESLAIWRAGNEAEALTRLKAGAAAMRGAKQETAAADKAAADATDLAIDGPATLDKPSATFDPDKIVKPE